jgi:hypothetical protein
VFPESEQVHWIESGPPIQGGRTEHDQPMAEQPEGITHKSNEDGMTPSDPLVTDEVESPDPTTARAQPQVMNRSGRVSRLTTRREENQEQQREGLVALFLLWEVSHDGGYQIVDKLDDLIAFVESKNPDIMCLNQAMREPDSAQFEQAMIDKVTARTDNNHWDVIRRVNVPSGLKVLLAVWAIRPKRRITMGTPYKW